VGEGSFEDGAARPVAPEPDERGPERGSAPGAPEAQRGERDPEPDTRSRAPLPRIPGYRLLGVIGRGSTGVVYRARQLVVDREVALKVLHPELAGDVRVVRRLRREARTTARLAHPHVVSAVDMGQVDGLSWYAMELVDGPSLALRLRQEGRLSERRALRLFIPLCEALVHMWENGVVHRDIKPANILIDDVGGARLADLGLAFADDDPVLTRHGGTLGTPHYISPEQAREPSSVDVRSDIWSFGATLYHAVCGEPPFRGESLAEVLSAVLYAQIPEPRHVVPELSRGLSLVLRKCLSRSLERRYQDPRELLADLERVRERRAPRIPRNSLDPSDPGTGRSRLWLAAAAAAVALVPAAWLLTRGSSTETPVLARPGASESRLETTLGELAARAEAEPPQLAAVFAELASLDHEGLAAAERAELAAARARARHGLGRIVRALRVESDAALEDALSERRFGEARLEVDAAFAERLRTETGFTVDRLPADLGRSTADWLAAKRDAIDDALAGALDVLREAVELHEANVLAPEVERRVAEHAWVSALDLLDLEAAEWVAAAGHDASGVPPDALRDALAEPLSRLRVRHEMVRDDWARLDAELHDWVARRAERVAESLRARELREGAGAELRAAFARELEERGVREAEIPLRDASAVYPELDRRARELDALADELVATDARNTFEFLDRDVCQPLWTDREYGQVRAAFEDYVRYLADLPGDGSEPWRERLERRVELRLREADLLAEYLDAVATAVRLVDGREVELRVGSIGMAGRVRSGVDPLGDGFRLLLPHGLEQEVDLRQLDTSELEMLLAAALEVDPGAPRPSTVARARLHLQDGEPRRALALLVEVGDDAALAESLRDRAREALEADRAEEEQRREEAQTLLTAIGPPAEEEPRYNLDAIERLLTDYADLEFVRERAGELRERRDRITAPPRRAGLVEFRQAFGLRGDAVELVGLDEDRVRLTFEFGAGSAGAWEPGRWRPDGVGWRCATDRGSDWAALLRDQGPRLLLRQGAAEVDPTHLELAVRIEQLPESGQPRLLLISAAGFHASLAGPGLAGDGRSRWRVTSGSLAEHLEGIGRGEGTAVPSLLERGRVHDVRLVIHRRRGRLKLHLDGRAVASVTLPPPDDGPGGTRVEIRSLEPIRLLAATLEGSRP